MSLILAARRLAAMTAVFCLLPAAATAQPPPDPQQPADSTEASTDHELGLNSDRKVVATLAALRQLVSSDTDRAIEELQRLQAADPQSMVPTEDTARSFEPLFRTVFQTFHQLPADRRRRLAGRSEAAAERALAELLTENRLQELPQLILQAPGTRASYDAHFLIARLHDAQGHPLAARLWLQPLLNKAIPDTYRIPARQLLTPVQQPRPAGPEPLPDRPAALPVHLQWHVEADLAPALKRSLKQLRDSAPRNLPVESTWVDRRHSPLLLRRTLRGIAAKELDTGRTAWHYRMDASPTLDGASRSSLNGFGDNSPAQTSRFDELQRRPETSLFCRDNITGRLTTGDGMVFAVTSNRPTNRTLMSGAMLSRSRTPQRVDSRLVALEAASGRRVWSCGAELLREHFQTESDYCWIFGPPTATPGELLCVVEWDNEIHLVALRPSTGEPVWSVLLAFPPQSIHIDPVRQFWSAVPDYSEGLVWCASTTGWTLCIDTVTRTIAWANFAAADNVEEKSIRVGRGSPVALTQPAELSQRWTRSVVRQIGRSVVTCPHTTRHIFIRDALSGDTILQRSVRPGTVLMHLSEAGILICEPDLQEQGSSDPAFCATLTSLSADDGSVNWTSRLPAEWGVATGSGSMVHGEVLVPVKSGRLVAIDPATGRLRASDSAVLPQNGWGSLIRIGSSSGRPAGDVLYSSPDVLLRLSAEPPSRQSNDPLERAEDLAAARQWEPALRVLDQIDEPTQRSAKIAVLRFRILRQLAHQDPARWLPALQDSCRTPQQQVQATLLEAAWQIRQKETASAIDSLVRLLKMEPHLTDSRLPDDLLAAAGTELATESTRRSVRSAACRSLNQLLFQSAAPDRWQASLRELPNDVLLQLYHPVVRPVLHDRIGQQLNETAWHLLRHSVDLAPPSADDATTEPSLIAQLLHSASLDSGSHAAAVHQLLNASLLEFPGSIHGTLQQQEPELRSVLAKPKQLEQQFRNRLQQHFESWPDTPARVVPVLRNTSINTTRTSLIPALLKDDFLRRYRWTASRGDAGRLQGQNIFDGDQSFSIPGAYDVYGVYSNRTDVLHRCGTVLLLQSYRGIAAVSVLDQTVLWSMTMPDESAAVPRSADDSFTDFNPVRHRIPSQNTTGLLRIVGAGSRWVCVVDRHQLQVLDLLNGIQVWSFPFGEQIFDRFIATDEIVLLSRSIDDVTHCLDRRSGEPRSLPDLQSLKDSALRSAGREVVRWNRAGTQVQLEWWNPVTDVVSRSVELPDRRHFSFLDDATLVGFDNQQTALFVDLITGERLAASFALPEAPIADDPGTQGGSKKPDDPASPAPLWSTERLQAAFDGWNYLISNRSAAPPTALRHTSGRTMLTFSGGLRAIDAQTGQLRWHLEGPADQHYLATTDQPELPLLLVIESTPVQTQQGTTSGVQNVFRGIRRIDGRESFRHPVPSRFGLRYTSFTAPDSTRLNLGLYGRRVEVSAQDREAKPSPKPAP